MTDYLTTLQRDADDTLQIYNEGRSIVEKLSKNSPICKAIGPGKTIQFGTELGSGTYGTVYDALFADNPTGREYVVKRVLADLDRETYYGSRTTLEKLAHLHPDVSRELFISLNGGNPKKVINEFSIYTIPSYAIDCMTTIPHQFTNDADPSKVVIVPPKSYLCEGSYIELLNGLLVAQLRDVTPHIVDMADMITCTTGVVPVQKVYRYIFMEKLGKTMYDEIYQAPKQPKQLYMIQHPEYLTSYLVQILVAITLIQERYQMVHGDSHLNNILMAPIVKGMLWQGIDLSTVAYFHYRLGGEDLYLPATPSLAKLADYGLTCKYSEPMVLEKNVTETGAAQYNNTTKTKVPWIPNFFSESYDLLFTLSNFYPYLMTPDVIQCLAWIMGTLPNAINAAIPTYIDLTSRRPVLPNLPVMGPREFLLSCPAFDKYRKKPSGVSVLMTDLRDAPLVSISLSSPKKVSPKQQSPKKSTSPKTLIHPRTPDTTSEFLDAIKADDIDVVKKLAPRQSLGPLGTGLEMAAELGNTTIIELLLDSGADPQANDDQPLMTAIYHNKAYVVRVLLDNGANADGRGGIIFKIAIAIGNRVIVEEMIDHGARVTKDIIDSMIKSEMKRLLESRYIKR